MKTPPIPVGRVYSVSEKLIVSWLLSKLSLKSKSKKEHLVHHHNDEYIDANHRGKADAKNEM
jgi:hypothetical protein